MEKQFSLYTPDLVVCCGTGDMFLWVLTQGGDAYEWKTTSRGVYHFDWHGVPVIAFPHPEARVLTNILMYAFIDAVKEILRHNTVLAKRITGDCVSSLRTLIVHGSIIGICFQNFYHIGSYQ